MTNQALHQPAPENIEQTPSMKTLTVFMPRNLSQDDLLFLAGVHPEQPVVYEVEPNPTGSGYQIVRYLQQVENGLVDKFRMEAHSCGKLPRYDVDELRLKLQVEAGYAHLVKKLGG